MISMPARIAFVAGVLLFTSILGTSRAAFSQQDPLAIASARGAASAHIINARHASLEELARAERALDRIALLSRRHGGRVAVTIEVVVLDASLSRATRARDDRGRRSVE